jgi:metallo-beta-lactamase family protein
MNITFHGAAQTVTGSKHLITLEGGEKILLDCGLFQGLGARTQTLNDELGFDASQISLVLLSHAHIDHSGLLPKMAAAGFMGKIYCTAATRDLVAILLQDSVMIQAHDDPFHQPGYSMEDVIRVMEQVELVDYQEWFSPLPGVKVLYTPTGHLIGAAAIHLQITENNKETTITYSADVGRSRHPLFLPATVFPQAEYIILESTYGDKHHPMQVSNVDILLQWITEVCVQKQGKLVIPAFSVGRTQEVLFLLHQLEKENRLPQLHYFVDSPLGIKATEIFKAHKGEYNSSLVEMLDAGDDPFSFTGLKYVETSEDSIRVVESKEPCVIIASSGTADAGRVRHHIAETISGPENAILFSGYCGPESLGGQLLKKPEYIELKGTMRDVKATIAQLNGLSAHGDSDDLCHFVSCQDPGLVRAIYLVHGEAKAQERLAARLTGKGFYPVHIPELHQSIPLNTALTTSAYEKGQHAKEAQYI